MPSTAALPNFELEASWKDVLRNELNKDYFKHLQSYIRSEYKQGQVYPAAKNILSALNCTPFSAVRVVLLGQDPYHGEGQANGLSFAVNPGVRQPPSLQNIFKELESDLGARRIHTDGDLTRWAAQGVLLLNATLTVRAQSPGSHQRAGWETFTDAVITTLSERREHLVFILWGNYARHKGSCIDRNRHCVIESAHPSPFSAAKGFFGSKPFSRANTYLAAHGLEPIHWL